MKKLLFFVFAVFTCSLLAGENIFYMRLDEVRINEGEWEKTSGLMTFKPSGEATIEIGQSKLYIFFDVSTKEQISSDPVAWDYYGTTFMDGNSEKCIVVWSHFEGGSYLKITFYKREGEFEYVAFDI